MPRRAHDSIELGSDNEDQRDALEDQFDDDLDDEITQLERQRDGGASPTEKEESAKKPSGKTTSKKDNKRAAADQPEKPKRVMAPRAKLDAERLCGPSGLPALLKDFEDVQWLGRGYEVENLELMMQKLEGWSHRMYPKLPFDDIITKIEHLGSKKAVKTCVLKLMDDMPVLPEDFIVGYSGPARTPSPDIFTQLFPDPVGDIATRSTGNQRTRPAPAVDDGFPDDEQLADLVVDKRSEWDDNDTFFDDVDMDVELDEDVVPAPKTGKKYDIFGKDEDDEGKKMTGETIEPAEEVVDGIDNLLAFVND